MIPQQTFESYPVFSDTGTKIKPDDAKYAAGFQQSDVLPAEWMNWAWNKNSKGITDLNRGMASVETEILNVLTAGGQTPAEATGNQLLQSINYLIGQAETRAKLAAHPIGSLYWSGDSTDPGQLFGGTWTPVKDCFVWAKGDSDTPNAIGQNAIAGGSKTTTLVANNLPTHTHTLSGSTSSEYAKLGKTTSPTGASSFSVVSNGGHVHGLSYRTQYQNNTAECVGLGSSSYFDGLGGPASGSTHTQAFGTSNRGITFMQTAGAHEHTVYQATHSHTLSGNTGDNTTTNTPVDIMPPHIIKYCWERTA